MNSHQWATRLKKQDVYLEDGRLEIDNNAAERSMKNLAVGKKNYLFAGSDKGDERAATIYSLIETAKLNNVNPQGWLTHVINTIQDYPNKQNHDLLPWNWKQERRMPNASTYLHNVSMPILGLEKPLCKKPLLFSRFSEF